MTLRTLAFIYLPFRIVSVATRNGRVRISARGWMATICEPTCGMGRPTTIEWRLNSIVIDERGARHGQTRETGRRGTRRGGLPPLGRFRYDYDTQVQPHIYSHRGRDSTHFKLLEPSNKWRVAL